MKIKLGNVNGGFFICEFFFDFLKIIFLDVSCNGDHFQPNNFFSIFGSYPIIQLAN